MREQLYILMWVGLCIMYTVGAGVSGYISVTQDESWQWNPCIFNTIVVWEDHRQGNWDIYGYDFTTDSEFPITSDPGNQTAPSVYGDWVVWIDDRRGNKDIYCTELGTNELICVTSNQHVQIHPVLYAQIIIWQDDREGTWDIFGYDLSTNSEFQITTDPGNQTAPSVYGDWVVWTDDREGNEDIFGYNLSTGEELQITTDSHSQKNPAIHGDIVVWEDYRNGNADIYAFDIGERTMVPFSTDGNEQTSPLVSRHLVAWIDERHRHSDIYGSPLNTFEEFRISRDPLLGFSHDRYDLAIYERSILWVTEHNTHSTISGYEVNESSPHFQVFFLLLACMVGILLVICLFQGLHEHLLFWAGVGIFCGLSASFLEEWVTDCGTVFLLGGIPLLSLFSTLYTRKTAFPILTVCSIGITAGILDSLRVPWETSSMIMGITLVTVGSMIGIAGGYIAEKKKILQLKKRKKRTKPRFCPTCGKKMNPGWNICPYCKSDLDFTRVYDDTGN
jgi:beta propeller repeat protein